MSENHEKGHISSKLELLVSDSNKVLQLTQKMLIAAGSDFYPMDILAIAASKRVLSNIQGFLKLVETRNLLCAGVILRTHLDTTVRFSAAWLVENPHEFATDVIGGMEIRKIKDRQGHLMNDKRLVEIRSADYSWLKAVYERTSGYVHFSSLHFHSTVSKMNEKGTFEFEIQPFNETLPDETWVEMIDCFRELTSIYIDYISGWTESKIQKSGN